MYEDMSMEELEKLLTRKERLFVEEDDRDGNGTQAAIRAGYSPGKKKYRKRLRLRRKVFSLLKLKRPYPTVPSCIRSFD